MIRRQCVGLLAQAAVINGWTAHLPELARGLNLLLLGTGNLTQVRTTWRRLQCIDLIVQAAGISGRIALLPIHMACGLNHPPLGDGNCTQVRRDS
jgi:hypothetical protein